MDLDYVEMVNAIENRTEYRNLPEQCEVRLIHDSIPRLGICELKDGNRLIVRNGGEVLIPRSASEEIVRALHVTHPATETMLNHTKNKIFWPQMKADIRECSECLEFKRSKSKESTEVSYDQTCL